MNRAAKALLLVPVSLVACALMAGGANAQTWNPDATDVRFLAQDPTFLGVVCDTGTMEGTTDTDSDTLYVNVQFQEPCDASGLDAELTCAEGEFTRLRAANAVTNDGEVDELLPGFECEVENPGVCTLTVGPQVPVGDNQADLVGEGGTNSALDVSVDVFATNDNPLCGPTPGFTGTWAGLYEEGPVTIDP
jgi:hypothetical protein